MKKNNFLAGISTYSTIIILSVLMLIIATLTDLFGGSLLVRIVTALFVNLIVVMGMQVFMGNSGILAWAHVGFMGIGAYVSSICSMSPEIKEMAVPQIYPFLLNIQFSFIPSLLVGTLVAIVIAAIISYPLMRLSDTTAAISSFALLIIINSILVHWDRVTNGPRTLFGVEEFTTIWTAVAGAILILVFAYLFKESSLGLRLRASRDDFYAASAMGINITRVRYFSFIVGAGIAGFGGGLFAHYITSFTPTAFYLAETFNILAMLVVGGTMSVSGAVVGTFLVTATKEGIRAVENFINLNNLLSFDVVGLTEVLLATALIVVLIFRPQGILGGRELRFSKKTTGKNRLLNSSESSLEE